MLAIVWIFGRHGVAAAIGFCVFTDIVAALLLSDTGWKAPLETAVIAAFVPDWCEDSPTHKSHCVAVTGKRQMNGKLRGIPETLLIALWARATATQDADPIICDEKAVEMVSQIDYDFSRFGKSKLTMTGVAVRTMLLDRALETLLNKYPNAIVVNFGAGLDTRHARMQCNNIDWFEIDVPESIELRRQFFVETERYHFIAQSMFDLSWIQTIDASARPVLFLAEGLFMYFAEEELKPFFCALANHFPGTEMIFEMVAPFMVGKSKHHETVRKIDSSAEFRWSLLDTRQMEGWHPSIRFVEEWNYFDYYKKRWGLFGYLARLPFLRPRFASRMVHLRFDKPASVGVES